MLRAHRGYKNRPLVGLSGIVFSNAVSGTLTISTLFGLFAWHIYSDDKRLGATLRQIPTGIEQPIKLEMPWKYRMILGHFQKRPWLKRRFVVGRRRTEDEKDEIRGRIFRKCLTAKWEARMNDQAYFSKERPTARDWRVKVYGNTVSNLCVRPWWGIPRR